DRAPTAAHCAALREWRFVLPLVAARSRCGLHTSQGMSSASQPAAPQPSGPDGSQSAGHGGVRPSGQDGSLPPGQNEPPASAPAHPADSAASAPVPAGSVPTTPQGLSRTDPALPTVSHDDPADPHASIYDHGFL